MEMDCRFSDYCWTTVLIERLSTHIQPGFWVSVLATNILNFYAIRHRNHKQCVWDMFSYQIEFVLGFLSLRNKTSKWCFILFWLLNCIKNIYTYRLISSHLLKVSLITFVEHLCIMPVSLFLFNPPPQSFRIIYFSKTCIYIFKKPKKTQKAKQTRPFCLA